MRYTLTVNNTTQKVINLLNQLRETGEVIIEEQIVAYSPHGTPLTLKQYNNEIEKGLEDIKKGRTFTSEELTKRIKSWKK